MFHLEDIVEQTGYVLEKDSEYSQRIVEEEEVEVSISVSQKGGKTIQHQVMLGLHGGNVMSDTSSLFDCYNVYVR